MTDPSVYERWCRAYNELHGRKILGQCRAAVAELLDEFPELTEVKGHTYGQWGKRAHRWAVTDDGTIVDPTRAQYPGHIEYEAFEPGQLVRVGTCMDCGAPLEVEVLTLDGEMPLHPNAPFCDDRCEQATRAYLNGGSVFGDF